MDHECECSGKTFGFAVCDDCAFLDGEYLSRSERDIIMMARECGAVSRAAMHVHWGVSGDASEQRWFRGIRHIEELGFVNKRRTLERQDGVESVREILLLTPNYGANRFGKSLRHIAMIRSMVNFYKRKKKNEQENRK
jgi:hypothetical protein